MKWQDLQTWQNFINFAKEKHRTMKRNLLSILVALLPLIASADVEINETTFPDDYFRNWVLAQSYGQDGVLRDEEIANVTKITKTHKSVIAFVILDGIYYHFIPAFMEEFGSKTPEKLQMTNVTFFVTR